MIKHYTQMSLNAARVARFFLILSIFVAALPFLAPAAQAADEIELSITIKDHKFEPAELKVPANTPVKLSVKNLDDTPEEFESHTLGVEKVIAGNASAIIRLKPLAAGTYRFFGEYHEATALGHIVVE